MYAGSGGENISQARSFTAWIVAKERNLFHLLVNRIFPLVDFSLESFFPFDGRTLLFFTGDISSIVESASSSSSSSSSPGLLHHYFVTQSLHQMLVSCSK